MVKQVDLNIPYPARQFQQEVEAMTRADRQQPHVPAWVHERLRETRPGFDLTRQPPFVVAAVVAELEREADERARRWSRQHQALADALVRLGFRDLPPADRVGDLPRMVIGDLMFRVVAFEPEGHYDLEATFLPGESWFAVVDVAQLARVIAGKVGDGG